MAKFTDNRGDDWIIAVDTVAVKRVRQDNQVDLADLTGQAVQSLADDPVLLVDVLWTLAGDQAKSRGVNPEGFAARLVGDTIEQAAEALTVAITDFFPARKRAAVKRAAEKTQRMLSRLEEIAGEVLNDEKLEEEFLAKARQEIQSQVRDVLTRLNSATSSPALSE